MINDCIVVGFGIAGMSVSARLYKQSKCIKIIDDDNHCTTKVSAGLFNPVFIKYLKKTWQADKSFHHMNKLYQGIENELPDKIINHKQILKLLKEESQVNNWNKAIPKLTPYLSQITKNQNIAINAPFGFGRIDQTGFLDTALMKKQYRDFFKMKKVFIEEKFDYNALEISSKKIVYKGISARYIVFAEGMGMLRNPLFKNLPLYGNKGEWIIVKSPNLKLYNIVQSSVFVIPLGKDLYKIGSTYSREFHDEKPTEEAKNYLLSRAKSFLDVDMELVSHKSGIRPTLKDRRAVVGVHPQFNNVFILNGLGSRGILTAPYLSECLYNFIEKGVPIAEEIDLARFKNKHNC